MAISQGIAPHRAWLMVNGFMIPCLTGSATQNGTRRSSTFSGTVPLNYPGAEGALAAALNGGVMVENVAGSGVLVYGEFDSIDFHYGQNGTIVASGRDMSVKLHNTKINKKWTDQPTTQVVQDVCGMCGIGCSASGSGMIAGKECYQEHAKMADGETGASIIAKCAEQDNARWWCDSNGTLHYEIDPPGGGYSVYYDPGPPESSDAFTIDVKRNVQAAKQIMVTINSWHTKDKRMNSGQGQAGGGGSGQLNYQYNIPGLKQGEPQQRAQNKANEIARHAVQVTVKCVGDPTINVGSGLTLAGTAFAGAYVIDSIHHSFGMHGYTMTIQAKLPSAGGGGGGGGGNGGGGGGD